MTCDLKRIFEELAHTLPDLSSPNDGFIFSSQVLPLPPTNLKTDRLIIQQRCHEYNLCFRADDLWIQGSKETLRHLGLLILATVFHPTPVTVNLQLLHPLSDIRDIFIEFDYQTTPRCLDYISKPQTFTYYPSNVYRYPWQFDPIDSYDLPCFWLKSSESAGISEEDWNNRTVITGFGNDIGNLLLAELLLNASQPQNECNEYALEGDAGIRGVGRMSAEAHLFLPGNLGWDDAAWPPDNQ